MRYATSWASISTACSVRRNSGGWRPHITIQNKVPAKHARALIERLEAQFRPRSLAISGLGVHRYLDGPWERIATYPFRGV